MDEIISCLKEVKTAIALGKVSEKHVDILNAAIDKCEKKRMILEAMENPDPMQGELLASEGTTFAIQNATINIYNGYPPTFGGEPLKNI